jgi:hypothetical protein
MTILRRRFSVVARPTKALAVLRFEPRPSFAERDDVVNVGRDGDDPLPAAPRLGLIECRAIGRRVEWLSPPSSDMGFHPSPTTTPETQVPQSGTTEKAVACPERVGASRRVERGLQAGE